MTPVEFQFVSPIGEPVANAEVEIQLSKAGYDEDADGIVMPRPIVVTTDENGEVTVDLWPSQILYHVVVDDPASEAALHYKFLVPSLDVPGTVVRLQDIVVDGEMSNTTWDEAAILAIHDAKANAMAAQLAAEAALPHFGPTPQANPKAGYKWVSSVNGRTYVYLIDDGETTGQWVETGSVVAVGYETAQAAVQATNAAVSASNSATAAAGSASAAAGSATAAEEARDAAEAFATSDYAQAAADSASAAASSEDAAEAAADAAAESATDASGYADAAANSAANAAATSLSTPLTGLDTSDDSNVEATDTILEGIGKLAAKMETIEPTEPPDMSEYLTAEDLDGLVQEDALGEYTKTADLNKDAVGLGNVDNTSDADKPVSTAQAAVLVTKAPVSHSHTKAQVGLDQVDNTSDLDKPVSTAQEATHLQILSRLSILEALVGGEPPPPASEPPPAPPATAFDFSTAELPAGAQVVRSGSAATYIDSTGKVVAADANTPRFDHGINGTYRGLLLEKGATNILPNSRRPGGTGWTVFGSALVTLNAATAPNGEMEATRIQIPSGLGGAHGIRMGIALDTGTYYSTSIWIRSRAGASTVYLRDIETDTLETAAVSGTWTKRDLGGNALAAWINFDVANDGTTSADIEVWVGQILPGVTWDDPSDIINDTSGDATRPNELLRLTVPSGAYDAQITYDNGAQQTLFNVEATGDQYDLNPNTVALTGARIRNVTFSEPGGSTEPPAPGDLVLTVSQIIGDMAGKNDLTAAGVQDYAWNVPPSSSAIPGCTVMGMDPRGSIMPQWAKNMMISQGESQYLDDVRWPNYIPWMVIFAGSNHTLSGVRVHTKDHQLWALRKSDNQWVRLHFTNDPNWFPATKQGVTDDGTGGNSDLRYESEGGISVLIDPEPVSYVQHGMAGNLSINANEYYFLFHLFKARLLPDSPGDAWKLAQADLAMHTGADWIRHVNQGSRPNQCNSRIVRLTENWRFYVGCPFRDAGRLETLSPNTVAYPSSMMINNPPPFHLM